MPNLLNEEKDFSVLDWLGVTEGSLNQIYGTLGSGKTYMATRMALSKLRKGEVVYTSWPIDWEGYDEREDFFNILLSLVGLKRYFHVYPKENLHVIKIDENFFQVMGKLTSCSVFIDEGHIAYDSYALTRMSLEKRLTVLDTRHYDREVWIISQRPTAIAVSLRGNVARFFKCESQKFWKWTKFTLSEYQDLDSSEKPDEEQEPVSVLTYWGRKKYFNAYNSKYRRGGTPESQQNKTLVYEVNWRESWDNFFKKKGYKDLLN